MSRDRQEASIAALEARVRNLERLLKQAELRVATLTHQPRILDVVLEEELPPGESRNAKVMDYDGTDEVESGETVSVFNRYSVSFPGGAVGYALERPVRLCWDFMVGDCT